MPRFQYYSSVNSYIEPYSSSTDGGELVTEFNQRASLNVVGWKTVDLANGSPQLDLTCVEPRILQATTYPYKAKQVMYQSWMTGTKDPAALALSIVDSNLRIARGAALICGYYGDFMTEVLIPTEEIISLSDMGKDRPDDYKRTRLVKLQVITTQSTNNPFDERLIPPLGDVYRGVEIIIDDTLPQLNQLLLGTITRDVKGNFTVVNNSLKTRLISVEHISGAENYKNLVEVPDDNNLYGVKKGVKDAGGNVTNLFNINEWTWLAYNSVLGKFLRNMAKNPDDTGKPGGMRGSDDVEMLGMMVGWATNKPNKLMVLEEVDDDVTNYDKAKPYLTYRVLTQGDKQADCYSTERVYLPFANYAFRPYRDDIPTIHGLTQRRSGIVTPETLWQIDQMWADRDSFNTGTQYGPFLNLDDARNWMANHAMGINEGKTYEDANKRIQLTRGDYFWVLSDKIDNYSDIQDNPTTKSVSLSTDYGTVSGTYVANTSGEVTASFNNPTIESTLTGTAEGAFSGDMETEDKKKVSVSGELTTAELNISTADPIKINSVTGTATGTGTGSITAQLTGFTQNVSARYVYLPVDPTKSNSKYEWKKQAVMRGFACPATPQNYGFVRPSSGSNIGDVINDPDKNQLRLDSISCQLLQNGGWKYSTDTAIILNPTSENKFAEIENTWFLSEQTTIKLTGSGWDSAAVPSIHRIRGNIILDFSEAVLGEGATALVLCDDVNIMTLIPGTSTAKVNTKDCVITTHNFNSVYHWQNTVFDSGSNTALVNNPWMTVKSAFSHTYENSLQVRFVSVTRGEYGIETAEMDIWIKREDWTIPGDQDNLSMTTMNKLKFPPLLLRLDDAGNICERQDIEETLNAKVSGTGGTHRSWDDTHSRYVMTGNWISTIDWENGEELSLNGRMLSPTQDALHGLYDVRFRALVQFTHADDMLEQSVDYSVVHQ